MVLDRLSTRAKNVIQSLANPKTRLFSADDLIAQLNFQKGFGHLILSDFTRLKLPRNKKFSLIDLLEQAFLEAFELKHPYVGTEHLALALLQLFKAKEYKIIQKKVLLIGTYPKPQKRTVDAGKKTPILDAFGTNLTRLYEQGHIQEHVEREEVTDLIEVLLQKDKPNPLIVGEYGVGKSSLVKLLSQKISDLKVPSPLTNLQIIEFDLSGFLGSVLGREGIEAGLNALSDELFSIGNIILFIKDIHLLFMPPGLSIVPPFAGNLFKSNILFSGVQIIASTSSSAYQKYLLEDENISSSFSIVRVKEPPKKTSLLIMKSKASDFEKFHHVEITDELLEKVYVYADKYLKNAKFPQKGIELLDKASSIALAQKSLLPQKFGVLKRSKKAFSEALKKALVSRKFDAALKLTHHIKHVDYELSHFKVSLDKVQLDESFLNLAISKELNIPLVNVKPSEDLIYAGLENRINKKILGQEKAVKALSTALIRSRLGLKIKKGPLGNFLFLGPTGVGKTELARVLSDEVFGNGGLIKLDMSDFAEKHTVSRLVGAPPGYIGYNEGGELTEKISRNPYSVVLFDEIEKAHPDVLNILLQILEDGVLVDGKGRSFDFSNSIVILTSNLGSELIDKDNLGFRVKFAPKIEKDEKNPFEERLLLNLKEILRPELLNRFDDVIVFNRLNKADIKAILAHMLTELTQNLKEKKIKLNISEKAKEFVIKNGYSEEYGARALRRVVDKFLIDEIARLMISNKVKEGSLIKIEIKAEKLDFRV